ncbi:uncharacterized protein [Centruroides vittatus]|uniref:uncharacterized protein n=1 Tax=Centruroides vittatus TaxID=120091 RepID=UPI003510735E
MHAIDNTLKKFAKRWLNLPQRASAEILYLTHNQGGANFLPLSSFSDIAQINHALHIFQSRDERVTSLALSALTSIIHKRIRRAPSARDICTYLNGSLENEFGLRSHDIRSTWTRLRDATRRLRKVLPIEWVEGEGPPALAVNGNILRKNNCNNILIGLVRLNHLLSLQRKPDQGKAFRITSACRESNHFLRDGRYTQFADWRFIHRARLSVVPLHGLRRFGNRSKKCRRCTYGNETLAHVLCHCLPSMTSITKRHDNILRRLSNAFTKENGLLLINQRVPDFTDNCRPDLVYIDDAAKEATIVDVTVPFENGEEAFSTARTAKIRKYQNLVSHFRNKGFNTFCDAFVVGALGGWDPANESILRRLAIPKKYAATMKRLMVSDTIKASREIFTNHIYGYNSTNVGHPHH